MARKLPARAFRDGRPFEKPFGKTSFEFVLNKTFGRIDSRKVIEKLAVRNGRRVKRSRRQFGPRQSDKTIRFDSGSVKLGIFRSDATERR